MFEADKGQSAPLDGSALRIGIVQARFNEGVTNGLRDACLAELAALGVRRVSVGGALARAAWGGLQRAARQLAEQGRFDGFEGAVPGRELNQRMQS